MYIETFECGGRTVCNPGARNTSTRVQAQQNLARSQNRKFLKALRKAYPHCKPAPRPVSQELVESLMAKPKEQFDPAEVLARNRELAAALYREKVERRRPLSTAVIESVAQWFDLTPSDITGKSRFGHIVSARFVAMRLLFEMRYEDGSRRFSYPMIGRFFGGRDHSTIIHAMRTFDDRARAYPEMREAYEALRDR